MRICAQRRKRNKSFLCPFSVSFHVVAARVGERVGLPRRVGGIERERGNNNKSGGGMISLFAHCPSLSASVSSGTNIHGPGQLFHRERLKDFLGLPTFFAK